RLPTAQAARAYRLLVAVRLPLSDLDLGELLRGNARPAGHRHHRAPAPHPIPDQPGSPVIQGAPTHVGQDEHIVVVDADGAEPVDGHHIEREPERALEEEPVRAEGGGRDGVAYEQRSTNLPQLRGRAGAEVIPLVRES